MPIADWFRPKWEHSNERIRLDAIRELSDQTLLERIAKNDSSGSVRAAAVERLTDVKVLADIAREDGEEAVAMAALARVSDQKALAAVAKEGSRRDGSKVCQAALGRVTDQPLLIDIAKTAERTEVRQAAVERVQDRSELATLAKYSKDSAVSLAATRRIVEAADLEEVARFASSPDAREAAVERITDQDALIRVAVYAVATPEVRSAALRQITDPAALIDLAYDAGYSLREDALGLLVDQTSLARVAVGSLHENTRQAALSRVTDQVVLAREQERAANEKRNRPTVWFYDNDQRYQLCRVDLFGEGEESLPIHEVGWMQQVENRLYYVSSADSGSDGAVRRLLLPEGGPDDFRLDVPGRPVFVDGDWLYFLGQGSAAPLSRVKMSAGTTERVLDDNIRDSIFAFFTIENDTIYYRNCDDKKTLYCAGIGGHDRRKLTSDELRGIFDSSHPFRLHGGHVFYSNRDDGGRLYRIGKDGSGRVRLTDFRVDLTAIDGDWIYYTDDGLYRMRLDGSGRIRVGSDKCWAARLVGRWLVYPNVGDGHKLYRISTNGVHHARLSEKRASLFTPPPYKVVAG